MTASAPQASALAMWPLVSQLKLERFHTTLVARQADLSGTAVDSAYRAGEARLFQHILFQVPPSAAPAVDAQKRRQAEQVLPQAKTAGAQFSQLARRYSEDPGSKVQGGALGVSERGQFVAAFEDAAWQLPPGGVSGLVKRIGDGCRLRLPSGHMRLYDTPSNPVFESRQPLTRTSVDADAGKQ